MDAFKKIDRAYKHEPESPESKKHMASAMKRGKGMALAKKKMKEEVEQVDELKKSTLASYRMGASADRLSRKIDAHELEKKSRICKKSNPGFSIEAA
jgi:hypothetical protein